MSDHKNQWKIRRKRNENEGKSLILNIAIKKIQIYIKEDLRENCKNVGD